MAETTDRGERHLRILVLHGLLDADEEPAKQLERLVSALYTVVSRADVVVLRWSPADPRRAMLAAARGTLGTRFAERFRG